MDWKENNEEKNNSETANSEELVNPAGEAHPSRERKFKKNYGRGFHRNRTRDGEGEQKGERQENRRENRREERREDRREPQKKEEGKSKKNVISKLKVIPLGGLDEIGKNCAVIQYDDEMVVVDLGLAFPDETMPGVELVVPDFNYIYRNIEKLKAVIITHGHEDHIGSMSHFLRNSPKKDIPIYSSSFTLGLIEGKLREKFRNKNFELRAVENRDKIHVGKKISVEFIRITHSIPESFVVAIHTPEGIVVHTGDYKFDLTPVDGKHADFYKLAELGEKGTLLLLSDSTNANKEGFTPSEMKVVKSFRDVVRKAKGRIIVSVFSSHAHRVQEMIKIGHEFGRKTALDGRSMHRVFEVGQDTGNIDIPKESIISLEQAPSLPEEKVLIICTGTQGELMSSMSRAARGEHREIKIEKEDVVIMSANSIPGNEVNIGRVVNDLFKKGAEVYKHGDAGLHVSGHGCRGDIALMLNLIRPRYFMPVHGEYMHLVSSKALAVEFGMKPEDVIITKNGDVVSITDEGVDVVDQVEAGDVLVDNANANGIGASTVKDRNMMAQDGLVVIHALINTRSRKINGQPEVIVKGLGSVNIAKDLSREIVLSFGDKKINDIFAFKQDIKDFCRKEVKRKTSKQPMIIPIVATV